MRPLQHITVTVSGIGGRIQEFELCLRDRDGDLEDEIADAHDKGCRLSYQLDVRTDAGEISIEDIRERIHIIFQLALG